jgi:hypothetical protein
MRGSRRGIRRWFWITLVILPVAALLLINLWLACPPGRAWIAGKIQHRVGLEVRIGRTSVWPWSGVALHEVELLQPPVLRAAVSEPLGRIATMRLTPVWREWFRGKRELRAVLLDSPQLVVPVELLADLAKSKTPAPVSAPPAVVPPAAVVVAPPFVGPPAPTPPTSPPTPPKVSTILKPTAWLHLKNASFSLFSAASGKSLIDITGLSGSIPIAGSSAESTLIVHSIRAGGEEFMSDLSSSLEWEHPLLSLKPIETEIHDIKVTLAGKLGMLSGLPLQIEALLPRQALESISLPANNVASAEVIAANARFRGLLLAPGTWQGDFIAEAEAPSGSIAGHEVKFDHGSSVSVLRGGLLSCVDARLIGDDLSFLGNGSLLADGRLAAALRMVAAPESLTAIAGRTFKLPQGASLTPLSTPQRAAFDLEAAGNISQIFLRLGREGPIVELNH